MKKIEKKYMFHQCLNSLIQNGPCLHKLSNNLSLNIYFFHVIYKGGSLRSFDKCKLQYLCLFCISVHRYLCKAPFVSVYTDTERATHVVNSTYCKE